MPGLPDPDLDEHVTELLGGHHLGSLSLVESDAVDRHLRVCVDCRAVAVEVVEVVAALALLDDGEPEPDGTDIVPQPARVRGRSSVPLRPAGPAPTTGPAGRGRTRLRRIALTRTALALALLLFAGFGTLFVANRLTGGGSSDLVTVAVTGHEAGTGASASVSAAETADGLRIRVTVTDLRPGISYQLDAVTRTGRVHEVSRWTGGPGVREVDGEAPVRLADLDLVRIRTVGGPPVVTVYLDRPAN